MRCGNLSVGLVQWLQVISQLSQHQLSGKAINQEINPVSWPCISVKQRGRKTHTVSQHAYCTVCVCVIPVHVFVLYWDLSPSLCSVWTFGFCRDFEGKGSWNRWRSFPSAPLRRSITQVRVCVALRHIYLTFDSRVSDLIYDTHLQGGRHDSCVSRMVLRNALMTASAERSTDDITSHFLWPLLDTILGRFDSSPTGQRNDSQLKSRKCCVRWWHSCWH